MRREIPRNGRKVVCSDASAVIVIAQSIERARLPSAWHRAMQLGTVALVSMYDSSDRLTSEIAARRNNWIARCASQIVVAHATDEGGLVKQTQHWEREGHRVRSL